MTARSPTQSPSTRPTAPTDPRRLRPPPQRSALCTAILLAVCCAIVPVRFAQADERCLASQPEDCTPASRDAPDPLNVQRSLQHLLAALAPLAASPGEPLPLQLAADLATFSDDTLELDGALVVQLGNHDDAPTLEATRLALRTDGTFVVHDGALTAGPHVRLTFARLARTADGTLHATELALSADDTARGLHLAQLTVDTTGVVVAEGIALALCGCPGGGGLLEPVARLERLELRLDTLAPSPALQAEPPDDDEPLELEGLELELAGVELPLWTGPVYADGRATGLVAPRLAAGSEVGFEAELPVFVRLGRHADLLLGAGWATAIGPVFSLRERHHLDAGTRGELSLRGRYDLDGEALDLSALGAASLTVLERLRFLARLDLLTRPALHAQRHETLADRARRGGRTLLAAGWDGEFLQVGVAAELLQSRPRLAEVVAADARDEPFPAALPAAHRLPSVSLGALAWPLELLRFDLDARFVHVESFGTDFVDLGGEGGGVRDSVLGPLATPRPGDGVRDPGEPLSEIEHVVLRAGLELPLSLAGYGVLRGAAALEQRFELDSHAGAQSGFARHTAVEVEAELATSLVAVGEGWRHVLRPRLGWRSRVLESVHDRLGAPSVARDAIHRMSAVQDALELGVAARWFGTGRDAGWVADGELLGVVVPSDAQAVCGAAACGLGVLRARLAWQQWLELRALVSLPAEAPESTLVHGTLGATFAGVRLWLSHLEAPAGLGAVFGEPRRGVPAEPWRWPGAGLESEPTRQSELGASWSWAGFSVAAAVALVHEAELGVEARGALGYSGECGCWHLGVALERHATWPTWDAMAVLRLVPGADAGEQAFYAPRVRGATAW